LICVGLTLAEHLSGAVGPAFASDVGCACHQSYSTLEDLNVLNAAVTKGTDTPYFVMDSIVSFQNFLRTTP